MGQDNGFRPQQVSVTEGRLRAELKESREAHHAATRAFEVAVDRAHQGGLDHPDGAHAFYDAARAYNHALRRYSTAVRRFAEFILNRASAGRGACSPSRGGYPSLRAVGAVRKHSC